jgi:diguanylate cyclase (GGDEF)-like protein
MLACAPLFAALYYLLPTTGLARTFAYPVFGIIATAAILVAIRFGRPARPRSWALIAAGLVALSAGDVVYSILFLNAEEVPYPSVADAAYVLGYVFLAFGIHGLARGRMAGGDRLPMIDGAILASGAASIFWLAIIRPAIHGSVDVLAATISLAYPCLDLVLLGLAFRVLLSSGARPRYLEIFVAGLALYFAADVIYAMAVLEGTYSNVHPVDLLWIVGVTLWGAAALHPSTREPVATVEGRSSLSRSRLALLAVAAMLAPAILAVRAIGGGADEELGLIVGWTLLFGLVLIRLATTVDDLAVSLLQRHRLQEDLTYQAHHDPLTRLANRILFEERLASAMSLHPETTGLIFIDLDDFKAINDTLGHASGDELLQILAVRIQRELRSSDLAARLGGDEFAILVADPRDETTARLVAERILGALRAPVTLAGRHLQMRASAGVAIGRAGATPMDLMRDADIAMYQAKLHGKDQAETYEPHMHSQVVRAYELRTELAAAIEAEEFVLHYQPVLALETDAVIGAEALVRWRHPERGLLGPGDFIPQAESSGLIHELGRWILRDACRTAAAWPTSKISGHAAVSVNLAAAQLLHPGFVAEVADLLAETGLPPDRLFLEVTESALVDFLPASVALQGLRALGIRLALDDFGTGYSALSYLAELPFDIVKIDRGFIATIGHGPRVDALLEGIVGLTRSLDMMIVAEGIETEYQLARIRELGFDAAQGFLFARPMSSEAFAALFAGGANLTRVSPGVGALPTIAARKGMSAAG